MIHLDRDSGGQAGSGNQDINRLDSLIDIADELDFFGTARRFGVDHHHAQIRVVSAQVFDQGVDSLATGESVRRHKAFLACRDCR